MEVKAVVGFYGVYDMLAQWEHDQITRPRDQITEKLLGGPPMISRKIISRRRPLSYVTIDKKSTRFLLVYGREDDIVDPTSQSEKFLTALKQAGFYARQIVVPGAGHFWASDPIEEPGSYGAQAAPQMLRFLVAWNSGGCGVDRGTGERGRLGRRGAGLPGCAAGKPLQLDRLLRRRSYRRPLGPPGLDAPPPDPIVGLGSHDANVGSIKSH